jgi:energy-converting hydrogenase B subunit D
VFVMQVTILFFVGATGLAVVLTRDPARQTIAISFYGLLMALMFFLYQAPDVALSQITVGAVALPLMIMLALAKVRRIAEDAEREKKKKQQQENAA